ncbi:MAG: extracellular solute-binding protein [Candidatus Tectomicrobia bacterium]|uniref:Extracellular solute-binding protein n=1 Tax=Tectimicrobiota bacterium TaxID=2528274 RepID=A0A932GRI2_UNCTE|nr:extracellular solute-binding protein [Candidatus Tectomicrobia bacterium]
MKTNKIVAVLVAFITPLLLLASAERTVAAAGAKGVDADLAVPRDWLEKAKTEGKLVLYSTDTPQQQAEILKRFTQRYPFVKVDYLKAPTEVRYQKVLLTARQGIPVADIVTGINGGGLKNYLDAQALAELSDLPAWRTYSEDFKHGAMSIGFRKRYYGLAYNTNLVSKQDLPRTWGDLLEPKWNGQVAFNSIASSVWLNPLWHSLGPERAARLMDGFARNKAQFRTEGADASVKLLAAGEYKFAIPVSEYNAYEVAKVGGPVDWLAVDPLPVVLGNIQILRKAAHPFAAKLYVNWILSEEGQEVYAKVTGANPVHPDLQAKSFNFPDLAQRVKGKKQVVLRTDMEMGWGADHAGVKLWQKVALGGF